MLKAAPCCLSTRSARHLQKSVVFWDTFLLDPQASQLQVAKKAKHDEIEEAETTKDWYTADAVMRMQGTYLEPGQAGYKEAKARAVAGLPDRPHRHKSLADAGLKE